MEPRKYVRFWGCILFFVAVLVDLPYVRGDRTQYVVLHHRKSWTDADMDCRSRQGRLLILDTHSKVIDFQNRVTLKSDETYWTAAYRKNSPWLWIEGCFSTQYIKHQPVRIPDNHAPDCADACNGTTYAALQGSLCYCLEDLKELLPLDSRKCSTPCSGSSGEMCGGPEAVTLYSVGGVKGIKEESRSDWKNCVYILKHGTTVWVTADCRKSLPFLCKIYRENGAITEYRSPEGVTGSWTEARALCREEGGTLADLHSGNMEAVTALPDHSEFWVGLYRNTSWGWHTADDIVQQPSWCTSIQEDERGQLHFDTSTCSLPFSYVCQTYNQAALTSPDASHLAVFVALGTIAWILATVAVIVLVYLLKKRKCRRNGTVDNLRQMHTNYIDLDEEFVGSQHSSYVNNQASCSTSRDQPCSTSCDTPSKQRPGCSQAPESPRYYTINGNEYATVMFHANDKSSQGACADTTRTSGEYDLVWDSLKYRNFHVSDGNICESRPTSAVYAQVNKVKPDDDVSDYIMTPPKLFPVELNREDIPVNDKKQLGRVRSKSL